MSELPAQIPQPYREAVSRAVLCTRLALHTYVPGHEHLRSDLSSRQIAAVLREAAGKPLTWSEEDLRARRHVREDMSNCSHRICRQASTGGPIRLREITRRYLTQYSGSYIGHTRIGEVVMRIQDILTFGLLSDSQYQTEFLAQVFTDPSELNPAHINYVLSMSTCPIMPRGGPRWLDQHGNMTSALEAGRDRTLQEVNDDFLGTATRVTAGRKEEQEENQNWESINDGEYASPDWTLGTVSTGHWSAAAWATRESYQHYRLG